MKFAASQTKLLLTDLWHLEACKRKKPERLKKKENVIMYCVLFTHSFINCRHFGSEALKSFLIIYNEQAAGLVFVLASVSTFCGSRSIFLLLRAKYLTKLWLECWFIKLFSHSGRPTDSQGCSKGAGSGEAWEQQWCVH